MVKTQIFIVCDKCEKPFNDTDIVYGYARYDNHFLTISEKNYTDYYFDEECMISMKKNTVEQLKKFITTGFVNDAKFVDIYIPYISETYRFHRLEFDIPNSGYFYVNVGDINQLVRVRYSDNDYLYSCFDKAVDLIFNKFEQGRLMDLRRKFKEEADRRRYESSTASALSACCSTDCTISGVETTAYN